MFRCHFCNQVTPPKTTRHTVVIAVREIDYPIRRKESKRPGGRFRGDEAVQDRGGKGREIAKEVAACPACAEKNHEAQTVEAATAADVSSATVPSSETANTESPATAASEKTDDA